MYVGNEIKVVAHSIGSVVVAVIVVCAFVFSARVSVAWQRFNQFVLKCSGGCGGGEREPLPIGHQTSEGGVVARVTII